MDLTAYIIFHSAPYTLRNKGKWFTCESNNQVLDNQSTIIILLFHCVSPLRDIKHVSANIFFTGTWINILDLDNSSVPPPPHLFLPSFQIPLEAYSHS